MAFWRRRKKRPAATVRSITPLSKEERIEIRKLGEDATAGNIIEAIKRARRRKRPPWLGK